MKILTITPGLGIGGTERVATNYAIGYKNAGYDSKVLYFCDGKRREKLESNGVECFAYSGETIAIISTWKPDVIHFHRGGFIDDDLKKVIDRLRSDATKLVETNVFGRVDYSRWYKENITYSFNISRWQLVKYKKWGGRELSRKGVYIPNCIDLDDFKPLSDTKSQTRVKHHFPVDKLIIGRVGQPTMNKWHKGYVRVAQELLEARKDVYFMFIGCPQELKDEFMRLENKYPGSFFFKDNIDDDTLLQEYYHSLDVFLHISKIGESFGMVLVESIYNSIPVFTVSTPFKDNAQVELVQNCKGGIVFHDIASLVRRLKTLSPAEAFKMGEDVDKAALIRNYSKESVIANIIKLLDGTPSQSTTGGMDLVVKDGFKQDFLLGLRVVFFELIHISWLYRLQRYLKFTIVSYIRKQ